MIGIALGLSILEIMPTRESVISIDQLSTQDQNAQQVSEVSGSLIDRQAPKFSLVDLHGQQIKISDFQGRFGIINFWATWCIPCLNELPVLQSRYDASNRAEFFVLAVNAGESKEKILLFLEDFDLTFHILLDPESEVQKLYQVKGYPVSFILDRDGFIRFIHYGAINEKQLEGYLSKVGF
jgi:peroxiredoxin